MAAADFVQNFEGQLDSFVPGVWCDPTTDLTLGKCMAGTGVSLWRFYASREKCYDKCFAGEIKGYVTSGSCTPPATDPTLLACISVAQSKAVLAIDKYCSTVGVDPSCGSPYPYPSGALWSSLLGVANDGNVPAVYCGFPSRAFVE